MNIDYEVIQIRLGDFEDAFLLYWHSANNLSSGIWEMLKLYMKLDVFYDHYQFSPWQTYLVILKGSRLTGIV